MMMGFLILGFSGGVTAGATTALMGSPWWAAVLVAVLAGNLVVAAAALLWLAPTSRGRRGRGAGQPEPVGRDALGEATRALGGMTLR